MKGGRDTVIMAVTEQRNAMQKQEGLIMAGQTMKTKYKAALYCRLSRDDGNVQESSSIQTQKEMLSRYARENGISETHFFIEM